MVSTRLSRITYQRKSHSALRFLVRDPTDMYCPFVHLSNNRHETAWTWFFICSYYLSVFRKGMQRRRRLPPFHPATIPLLPMKAALANELALGCRFGKERSISHPPGEIEYTRRINASNQVTARSGYFAYSG